MSNTAKGINLLTDKRNIGKMSSLSGRLKAARLSAISLLFLTGAVSVIISILIIFSPLGELKKTEEKAKEKIAVYNLDMGKIALIHERSKTIKQILRERPEYDKKIEIIQSKMPPDVMLEGITFDRNTYTFKFTSLNLSSLNDLIQGVTSITGKGKTFTRLYLTGISMDQDEHAFVLILDLVSV